MADIIDLKQYREEREPHLSGKARCYDCGHNWVAVAPVGETRLECPDCHGGRGFWIEKALRGGPHWRCACGSEHFCVTPDFIYCPCCGKKQQFSKG